MNYAKNLFSLYAITSKNWLNGCSLVNHVEQALKGGATVIQLRDKESSYSELINDAIKLKKLCSKYNVPLIINDNVEAAYETNCDGIHIGQNDTSLNMAYKLLGKNKIFGVTVENIPQALEAEKNGATYLGVGSIFKTSSKIDAKNVSIDTLKLICSSVNIPVVAIGGISKENIIKLKNSGISGIAVINAIFAQKDIFNATVNLKNQLKTINLKE